MKKQTQEEMLDILLRDAFLENIRRERPVLLTEEELREENIPPVTFSPEFEQKMEKLIRRARRMEWWQKNRSRVKRMTAMFAVVLLVGGLLVTKADAFRLPFLELIYTTQEKFTEIDVRKTGEELDLPEAFAGFLPTYVPEGFQVESVDERKTSCFISYENKTGAYYSIDFQRPARNSAIDTEDAEATEETIQGYPAFIIQKEKDATIIWYPEGCQYTIGGTISVEEIYSIIESIENF